MEMALIGDAKKNSKKKNSVSSYIYYVLSLYGELMKFFFLCLESRAAYARMCV
jgi:hypothetical protein